MTLPASSVLLAVAVTISPAYGQQGQSLHLLKGAIRLDSAQPWRSEILRVDEKAGKLTAIRDLGTEKFAGISFCLVNYEHRVIVMGLPADRPSTFLVLDMDDVQNPKVLRPDFAAPGLPVAWQTLGQPRDTRFKITPSKQVWVNGASLLFNSSLGLLLNLQLIGPNGVADFGLPIGQIQSRRRGGFHDSTMPPSSPVE